MFGFGVQGLRFRIWDLGRVIQGFRLAVDSLLGSQGGKFCHDMFRSST